QRDDRHNVSVGAGTVDSVVVVALVHRAGVGVDPERVQLVEQRRAPRNRSAQPLLWRRNPAPYRSPPPREVLVPAPARGHRAVLPRQGSADRRATSLSLEVLSRAGFDRSALGL